LRGDVEAAQAMLVKDGNTQRSATLHLREGDSVEDSARSFCAIYNTHRTVCAKLVTALHELRADPESATRMARTRNKRMAVAVCRGPLRATIVSPYEGDDAIAGPMLAVDFSLESLHSESLCRTEGPICLTATHPEFGSLRTCTPQAVVAGEIVHATLQSSPAGKWAVQVESKRPGTPKVEPGERQFELGCTGNREEEVVVLVWNPVGGFWNWYYRPPLNRIRNCGFPGKKRMTVCYTTNREHAKTAAAILFGMPWVRNLDDLPWPKQPHQQWIGVALETNGYFPQMPRELSKGFKADWGMDLTMTYEMTSDIPTSFFSNIFLSTTAEGMFQPPRYSFEQKVAKIGFMYSNCNTLTKRNEYIQKLMEHFPADSFGRCLYNIQNDTIQQAWKGHLGSDFKREKPQHMVKLDVVSRYLFTFAMENDDVVDWVTEKVFQALLVGTVPIYLGAPNVDHLLPCTNCIIKVADFASPAALAQHLNHLVANPAEYNKYLEWKGRGFDRIGFPGFANVVDLSVDTAHCRLCASLRPGECGHSGEAYMKEQIAQYDALKNGTVTSWSRSHEAIIN